MNRELAFPHECESRGDCRVPPLLESTVGGRYQVVRILEQNGYSSLMATAEDLREGGPVVLRFLPGDFPPADVTLQLAQELERRREMQSPWLATLSDLGQEGEHFFLVARGVSGISLAARLADRPLDLSETMTLATGVLSALRDVHAHGFLHGSLDPSQVFVDTGPPLAQVTLLDWALPWIWRGSTPVSPQSAAAAAYVAPEQAGFIEVRADIPADLYTAGILLYHCLAGEPPFQGDDAAEVLLRHVASPAKGPRSLGVHVPRALDELILRLLRKDPRDRYQTAEAVLADLSEIAAALKRGERDPPLVVGTRDRRATLTEPSFVSRSRELDALASELGETLRGRAGLVMIEGESGGGKTRLLDELAQRAASENVWVLRGQANNDSVKSPLQLLDGVVQAIVSAAAFDPRVSDEIVGRLDSDRKTLCSALPSLTRVLGRSDDLRRVTEEFGEAQSIRAVTCLLSSLGSPRRPAVVILDDCQWADDFMFRLIEAWPGHASQASRSSQNHVLLVVAFRTEEVPADHRLRKTKWKHHLLLAPFDRGDVESLLTSMAGPLPPGVVDLLHEWSAGSPFMASAILRGLVEAGALVGEDSGWTIDSRIMSNATSSHHAGVILSRRIELLPTEAVELLSLGAVLGKEFDLQTVAHLAGLASELVLERLDEAERRHFLWIRRDSGRCLFVHDKIRTALLSRLTHEQRRSIHRRAAIRIREVAPHNAFDLAYHFDAAGDSGCALNFALEAAEQARSQHSLEVAEQQYRIALRGLGAAPSTIRFSVLEGLGEVKMLRGAYDEAEEYLRAAAELADSGQQQAQITGKLGEVAFKRGQIEQAVRNFETALRLLGYWIPHKTWLFLVCLLWEIGIQTLHTVLPRWFTDRRRQGAPRATLLAFHFFSRLAHGYWFTRHKILGLSGASARHELGRIVSALAGTGPSLFGTRARDDRRWLVPAGDHLRSEILRHPPAPGRPLGPRSIAQLLRSRVVCRQPIRRVREQVP